MTRAEAVANLRARGLNAVERDWVMGQTIAVFTEPMETSVGITVYRRALYLVPHADGWFVEELDGRTPAGSEPAVMSLEEACDRAQAILSDGS
jgi:hypothetical protein